MATPYRAELVPRHRLPATFHALLDVELAPDERVVWVGTPSAMRLKSRALGDAFFALLWNFAIALLISAIAKFAGLLCLFGIPFLLVGLSLLVAPVQAFRDAAATFYVVTDARAIVFEGATAVSVPRENMKRLLRTERGDGSGDLVFFEEAGAKGSSRIGFYGVRCVREVERLLGGT
jgi:hypothetical protein